MKKSLIALAVAGAVAAPAAFAATANVDVYGKVRLSADVVDGNWAMNDRVSRIGFKGSEDLGGGLKALWQVESGFKATGGGIAKAGTDGLAGRNTFIGLAGGFGTVILGRHDTPYKLAGSADLFGDTGFDSQDKNGIIGATAFDLRVDNAIAYVSPDMSGFTVLAAIVPGSAADMDLTDAYSIAAVYKNGPLNASLAYEDHNNVADRSAWKVNVGYTFGDFKVGATYEDQKDIYALGGDEQNLLLSAAYNMGPMTFAAQWGQRDEADLDIWALGVTYAMSKRTNVMAMVGENEVTDGNDTRFSVQLNHDF